MSAAIVRWSKAGSLGIDQASASRTMRSLDLGFEQAVEELGVAGLLAFGVLEGRGECVGDRGEAEVVQVAA